MRKSLRQRVALFLSFSMAFTSIDSSVLVSAADVNEQISLAETANVRTRGGTGRYRNSGTDG